MHWYPSCIWRVQYYFMCDEKHNLTMSSTYLLIERSFPELSTDSANDNRFLRTALILGVENESAGAKQVVRRMVIRNINIFSQRIVTLLWTAFSFATANRSVTNVNTDTAIWDFELDRSCFVPAKNYRTGGGRAGGGYEVAGFWTLLPVAGRVGTIDSRYLIITYILHYSSRDTLSYLPRTSEKFGENETQP